MSHAPSTLAELLASLRTALAAEQARARVSAGLDAVLLGLLMILLGRLERLAQAWHPPITHDDSDQADLQDDAAVTYDPRHCLIQLSYVYGPGPGRGMKSHPRATPVLRPRSSRAPPPPGQASSVAFQGPARPRPSTSLLFLYRNIPARRPPFPPPPPRATLAASATRNAP